ncbi:MAG TPA: phage baseplate assembly protein V [Mariprofundaceae bacterium]|nr:phage baseplate assembly protein V [Mariprofundaceae bacterium]
MQETMLRLAKFVDEKRFGKYRGTVTDNRDKQHRGRLKLLIPSVLGEKETDWVLPCLPHGGSAGHGMFTVPEIHAQVWVEFEEGDIHRPIWVGTFWQQKDDVPKEAAKDEPTTWLLKTKGGHILQFDDKEGEERLYLYHPKKASLEIDKKGVVALTDAKGGKLTLDADAGKIVVQDTNGNTLTMSSSGTVVEDGNGNKVEMSSSGVNVKGQQIVVEGTQVMLGGQGGEPVIKGQSFLTLFMTHVHPTGVGPSGPPVPQGEMSSLSTKVLSA